MPTEKIVTLPVPIKRGTKNITKVTLTEPSPTALIGLEMTGVIRGDVAQLMILLPRISDLTEAEVKAMKFKNMAKLSMSITNFLGD